MSNFISKQGFLFYSLPINDKEKIKIDTLLTLLDESGVKKYLDPDRKESNAGRPEYDSLKLFVAIILGFALGSGSLREIEDQCRNDLRFIYLLDGVCPSYSIIGRFINSRILPNSEKIFSCIMKAMTTTCNVSMDTLFLDGTKHEANANKYKFVWKPTTFHLRLCDKARALLKTMNLADNVPGKGIFESRILAEKLSASISIKPESLGITEKALDGMRSNLEDYLIKALDYEEKERICGPNRNSYYKTDHDATAMCMKEDYYSGLGSNMHAAYNVQLIVSMGMIVGYYVSQDRADTYTLEPSIERFKSMYGFLPKNLVADAGYGCTKNYRYCEQNKINAYIKYNEWQGESSGRRPAKYVLQEDETIKCLNGNIGCKCNQEGRHPRYDHGEFYLVKGCTGCEFMPYCKANMSDKKGASRIFEVPMDFVKYKQKAKELLLSVKGIEFRVNRSCQIEGAFGIIKQDMSYWRARRISLKKVDNEIMLTCLGYNLRKFMRFSLNKQRFEFWKAPEGSKPGAFAKPSAKRLANREKKREERRKNNTANNKKTCQ